MAKTKSKSDQKVDLKKLALVVNGISLTPGLDLHSSQWAGLRKTLKAKRLGLMEKRQVGALWRETMYLVENPALTALDGDLEFAPRIHQFDPPPADHLSESLWRTGVHICFFGGRLFRWIVQVAGDSKAAELFQRRVEDKAGALFGEPKRSREGLLWSVGPAELRFTRGPAEAVLLLTYRPDSLT